MKNSFLIIISMFIGVIIGAFCQYCDIGKESAYSEGYKDGLDYCVDYLEWKLESSFDESLRFTSGGTQTDLVNNVKEPTGEMYFEYIDSRVAEIR